MLRFFGKSFVAIAAALSLTVAGSLIHSGTASAAGCTVNNFIQVSQFTCTGFGPGDAITAYGVDASGQSYFNIVGGPLYASGYSVGGIQLPAYAADASGSITLPLNAAAAPAGQFWLYICDLQPLATNGPAACYAIALNPTLQQHRERAAAAIVAGQLGYSAYLQQARQSQFWFNPIWSLY